MDTQTTLPPAKVIEREGHYFTGAQTVGSNQEKHRVISQPHSRGSVDASQKGADCLPRDGTWQLLELVKAWRINLVGQSGWNPVVNGQKSKKTSQGPDVVLQTCSTVIVYRVENRENMSSNDLPG